MEHVSNCVLIVVYDRKTLLILFIIVTLFREGHYAILAYNYPFSEQLSLEDNMKKRVAFVVIDPPSKEKYLQDLEFFFGDHVEFMAYSIKEGIPETISGELAIVTSPILLDYLKPYLSSEIEIIYTTRTIYKDSFEKLKKIEPGTEAMLVSNSSIFALDMISFLYRIGIKHIHFNPYYPHKEVVPDIALAITPGQTFHVPEGVKEVLDIGWRVFDIAMLMDVVSKLKIEDERVIQKINEHAQRIVPVNYGMHSAIDSFVKSDAMVKTILDEVEDGIFVLDHNQRIIEYNKHLLRLLQIHEKTVKNLETNSPIKELIVQLSSIDEVEHSLIYLEGSKKSMVVSKKPLYDFKGLFGSLFIVKDIVTIQTLESDYRKKTMERGHLAKYSFGDIIGRSEPVKKCKKKAMKIASFDKPVLITGETGTGKELYAQSIHNFSRRKKRPFVAINCAALPPSLLESELFGYDEGSFTGAKKGGKKGLFELAHGGTLFLDEVGDIPMEVQAALLRVLQEREVMRVGGRCIIPVDVRIIAATNKQLKKLVNEGTFREDLYYRLNVFSLALPSLQEIKEDIPFMIESIMEKNGYRKKTIDDELMEYLVNYPWRGNVRELMNCMENLAILSDEHITIEHLADEYQVLRTEKEEQGVMKEAFMELRSFERTLSFHMLKILSYRTAGRKTLHHILMTQGLPTTEYEIRKLLEYLKNKGYILYGRGRSGPKLTEKGLDILTRIS